MVGECGDVSKANISRYVAKTYNRTCSVEKAARPMLEQERTVNDEEHDAHAKNSTYSDVLPPQEDNEMTIVKICMVKDLLRIDGCEGGLMEVALLVKVEVDDFVSIK